MLEAPGCASHAVSLIQQDREDTMASRHMNSRRRSYGRRVHELRERAHEDRRLNREVMRLAGQPEAGEQRDESGWDRDRHDARGAD